MKEYEAVLVYGINNFTDVYNWSKILNLHVDAQKTELELFEIFWNYTQKYGFQIVYKNNFDSKNFAIGIYVREYNQITQNQKNCARNFCNYHSMIDPTFFSGMIEC